MPNQLARGILTIFGLAGGQHRHKGLTESTFGEQTPE